MLAPTDAVLGAWSIAGDLTVPGGAPLPHVPSISWYVGIALLTGTILLIGAVVADHLVHTWTPSAQRYEPGLRVIASAGLILLTVGMSVDVAQLEA